MNADKSSFIRDALRMIAAGEEELALVPVAREGAGRGGPPFQASVHIHVALMYAAAARKLLEKTSGDRAAKRRANR